MSADPIVQAALAIASNLAGTAEPAPEGLAWQAEIVIGVEAEQPVIGFGEIGATLYDGTAGVALGLAAAANAASPAEAEHLASTASGAVRHALAAAGEMMEGSRLGLFDGATGIALSAVTVGSALGDAVLIERGAALAGGIASRLEAQLADRAAGISLDLIAGLAGTMLGLQAIAGALGRPQPCALYCTAAGVLAEAAVPQTWGSAWRTGGEAAGGPPLLGLGHGAAGIALALAETGALCGDDAARRASVEGLEYERGWFDRDMVAWPDLRGYDGAGATHGWMTAWCHGGIGIGLSRLRIAGLTQEPYALAEASAALQAARNLVVMAGTSLQSGQASDCTACHGLGGVIELFLVASRALGVPEHALAARRAARLLLEQRDAAGGTWPCGLPGAGEIPGLMTGTAGIALTLLRAAGATSTPTPLLPGLAGW